MRKRFSRLGFGAFATVALLAAAPVAAERIERNGLTVDFEARSLMAAAEDGAGLMEGDYAAIQFRITDAAGEPVRGVFPITWLDLAKAWHGKNTSSLTCEDRIGIYLKGVVGMRPMIDLNSYYVLTLNQDATVTVLDPIVGITGKTKTFAQPILKRPGADWVKTRSQNRFYISMPRAEQVAVLDTSTFKIVENVEAGSHPVRVALQPDEKYLWVGNDSREPEKSGVTVIDTDSLKPVKSFATGRGHHEIAFTDDDRFAFISNRSSGTVTVIDIRNLEKVADIATGPLPISMAWSRAAKALFVADGTKGDVAVIDPERRAVVERIAAKPGLGPMRFTEDGRWGFVVNSQAGEVLALDASTNKIAHRFSVAGKPYQVTLTNRFAHVRSLESERVTMINIGELGNDVVPVLSFAAGAKAPSEASELNIADTIAPAAGEAAVLVANPADNNVYYYMEGMNAPMGNFATGSHKPLAVGIVDRTLQETEPGVYSAKLQIPAAGTYDVAMVLNSPRLVHCFKMEAKPNPLLKHVTAPAVVSYLPVEGEARVGTATAVRFRITNPETEEPMTGLGDVRVLYYRAPTGHRTEGRAREIGDGVYEAELSAPRSGIYYLYVGAPSAKLGFNDASYMTLRVVEPARAAKQGG